MIIATAGHVDHGKTTLVRALTGVDADRLPQEKARGMTIELGYAFREAGGHTLGFIDVPGHERLVHTMVGGVSGIHHALLVVAADDGPMPQTREHLAILDLLGVPSLTLVLSKCDRVDPERLAWVRTQATELVGRGRVHLDDTFAVSATTGEGIDALWAHLSGRAAAHRTAPALLDGGFRLSIDRSFTLDGTGCVVTGTVFSGRVAVGQRIVIAPRGILARVRSLRVQGGPADSASAGVRCALNLVGPDVSAAVIGRGDWAVDAALADGTDRVDVCLRILDGQIRLREGMRVHVHVAAKACTGRLLPLQPLPGATAPQETMGGAAGQTWLAQLLLDETIGARWGDRLVLRDWSAQHTVGGGFIVDPYAPARGRQQPARLAALQALCEADPLAALRACLRVQPQGVALDAFCRARNLPAAQREALLQALDPVVVTRDGQAIAHDRGLWEATTDAVLAAVAQWHQRVPTTWGPTEGELLAALAPACNAQAARDCIGRLLDQSQLGRVQAWLRLPTHAPRLDPRDEQLWRRLRGQLRSHAPCPVSAPRLALETGTPATQAENLLQRVARLGFVIALAERRYLLADSADRLAQLARDLTEAHGADGFSVAQFRDASGIGRKFCINVLEYFDRHGLTRRCEERRWWIGEPPPPVPTIRQGVSVPAT